MLKPIKTIKFFTLGCKANQYDTQSIRERFLSKGFEDAGKKKPNYFLINTCTVTASADQKSRNIIRRCIKANPGAKVIVTGCLAENDWQSLAQISGLGLVVKKGFFPEGISSFDQHTRAFLKVQDGCSNFCSYCKVALVRGKERSKRLKDIVKEAQKLVGRGYKEIVLTGICLGAYGKDLLPKSNLAQALLALERVPGLSRIRLSSIEAGDITLELIECVAKCKKFCRHLHIPIQSGDDSILKKMNRKYTGRKYLNLINRLKAAIPGLSITTDCLVGFPGESEKNFENTVKLVKKIKPLKVHIFPYSKREGTRAAFLKPELPKEVINRRCRQLEKIAAGSRQSFIREFRSKKVSILVENRCKDDPAYLEGLTGNYLKVKIPFKPGIRNKIIPVCLKAVSGEGLVGEYIDNS